MSRYSLVEGGVDDLGQPLVRVTLRRGLFTDSILAVVDTGFNGSLWFTYQHARALGLSVPKEEEKVILADGAEHRVTIQEMEIEWFGYPQLIIARISLAKRTRWIGGEHAALIGSTLFLESHVSVDYRTRRVRIER